MVRKRVLPPSTRQWLRRLNRFAADLNVLLVMFAIGLAMMDLTLLFSQRVLDRLPPVHVAYADTPQNTSGSTVVRPNLP